MATKISLPNGCSCSNLSVYPKNWETNPKGIKARSALAKMEWYISYRFYDPKFPKPKQKIIKGMNDCKTLKEKQEITRSLISNELNLLKNYSYNPHTDKVVTQESNELVSAGEISRQTTFLSALKSACDSVKVGKYTKRDLGDIITGLTPIIEDLRLTDLPIASVSRRHIRLILKRIGTTPHKFNKYRSYLIILFKELIEAEATDQDPVSLIKKQKTTKKMRLTLTKEERKKVSDHLFNAHYRFWRFMHIFFHSGSRESEMMLLQFEDVDLAKQRFKVIVQKDGVAREEWRTIKNIILPLWIEIMADAKPGQYLFAKFLKPGAIPIEPVQISRYWLRYVKAPPPKGLNIKADFYSLKHSNLDEIAELLSAKDASDAAGHTTVGVTKSYYLIHEKERQHKRLKQVNNAFVQSDMKDNAIITAKEISDLIGKPPLN